MKKFSIAMAVTVLGIYAQAADDTATNSAVSETQISRVYQSECKQIIDRESEDSPYAVVGSTAIEIAIKGAEAIISRTNFSDEVCQRVERKQLHLATLLLNPTDSQIRFVNVFAAYSILGNGRSDHIERFKSFRQVKDKTQLPPEVLKISEGVSGARVYEAGGWAKFLLKEKDNTNTKNLNSLTTSSDGQQLMYLNSVLTLKK